LSDTLHAAPGSGAERQISFQFALNEADEVNFYQAQSEMNNLQIKKPGKFWRRINKLLSHSYSWA
jgi:hypothetical protein